nr:ABC transporter permease subunit [Motiliproteus sp. SC1-56]
MGLLFTDIEVVTSEPWGELARIGIGLLTPDFLATEELGKALLNTLAFALVGVVIGNGAGFLLALVFHWPGVRQTCAFVRAIHEIFWALLFLQVFGLSTLTGVLAIALPYTGIFAKVYAEILEESDQRPWRCLPPATGWLSGFVYARLPRAFQNLKHYSLYRLECAIRSSAVLGFIGLPTLGFHLETAFNQGLYSQAAALLYLFFLMVASIRLWMRLPLLPVYLLAAIGWLPWSLHFSSELWVHFVTWDLVPAPLRGEWGSQTLSSLGRWLTPLGEHALLGAANTLILSLVALVGSGLLALGLFPLVSRLFFRLPGRSLGNALLIVLRTIPELILAFVFLLVLGPSMLPAILALALHNGAIIAHLIGRQSDSLKPLLPGPGSGRYFYEVLPRIYRPFLAFLFYRWEVIMRETAILGILGVYTLGFYIDSAFEALRFDQAFLLILMTALLNLCIDALSRALRRRLRLADTPQQVNP